MLFSVTSTQTSVISHDINVGDASPIHQCFYRVSGETQKILEVEVQYLLEHELTEQSFSSWASPCLLVNKSDGMYWFCTDYRKLSNVTKADSFPLPQIEDCVDQVGSAKFVSKFDLKSYWQIPLSNCAYEVSAFMTPSGLYTYKIMSFGLHNTPATFQHLMNQVIVHLKGCAVYLDDVVLYSDTWEQHLDHIRHLFTRLAQANLIVNSDLPGKSSWPRVHATCSCKGPCHQ